MQAARPPRWAGIATGKPKGTVPGKLVTDPAAYTKWRRLMKRQLRDWWNACKHHPAPRLGPVD
jgi:hypothetical protein